MKKTLYIPDELWEELTNYLKLHLQENLSSVVQTALKEKLRPHNGEGLLKFAGIVKNAPKDASKNINNR